MKKRIISIAAMCILCMSVSLGVFAGFKTRVHATEMEELTPMQIDEILKDVTPVEISEGVYLRDNGVVSIVDVDVSQFEQQPAIESSPEDGEIIFDNFPEIMPFSWDLSTDYIASFRAKFRVFTRSSFSGYDTLYAQFYDINCPSDSTWKGAIFINNQEKASSDWYASSVTSQTLRFYNLDTSKVYNIAFEKTDNGSEATGIIKVYK